MTAKIIHLPKRATSASWKPLTEVEPTALDALAQKLQTESMIERAFARTVVSRQPAERDPSDIVIDLTTPEGRAVCLEAERQVRDLAVAMSGGGSNDGAISVQNRVWSKGSARASGPAQANGVVRVLTSRLVLCPKCQSARYKGTGPHAPHHGEGPPGYGRAMVDCVGDVVVSASVALP